MERGSLNVKDGVRKGCGKETLKIMVKSIQKHPTRKRERAGKNFSKLST